MESRAYAKGLKQEETADGADGKEYMVEFDIFGTNRRKWSDTDVIMLRMVVLGVVNAISGQLTD